MRKRDTLYREICRQIRQMRVEEQQLLWAVNVLRFDDRGGTTPLAPGTLNPAYVPWCICLFQKEGAKRAKILLLKENTFRVHRLHGIWILSKILCWQKVIKILEYCSITSGYFLCFIFEILSLIFFYNSSSLS